MLHSHLIPLGAEASEWEPLLAPLPLAAPTAACLAMEVAAAGYTVQAASDPAAVAHDQPVSSPGSPPSYPVGAPLEVVR